MREDVESEVGFCSAGSNRNRRAHLVRRRRQGSIGQPRQIGARFGSVQAAVLAAKPLLVARR